MGKSRLNLATIIAILIVLFSFRLWQTTGCRQFRSFWLNPQAVTIKVEEDVGTDVGADKEDSSESSLRSSSLDKLGTAGLRGVDRNISRLFHNKLQTVFVLTAQSATSTVDAGLLLDILGPIGLVALSVSIYRIVKFKNLTGFAHLSVLALSIVAAIITSKTKQTFYLFTIILYSLCFWSVKAIAKWSILLTLILAIVSFWYFSLSWQLESFCHDIFFN